MSLTRFTGSAPGDLALRLSRDYWKDNSAVSGNAAEAVVLAPTGNFQFGAAAIPLAKEKTGPLLFSGTTSLAAGVRTEIERVLPAGKTVYLVGSAFSATVEASLRELGYEVVRYAGADPQETSLIIARDGIVEPDHVVIASVNEWEDAVSAASAVAAADGAILLSSDSALSTPARAWLDNLPAAVSKTTVGAAARDAYSSTAGYVVGRDHAETSAFAADRFISHPERVGIVPDGGYANALGAGAYAATMRMPLLLNPPTTLGQSTVWFVEEHSSTLDGVAVFGDSSAIVDGVAEAARDAAVEKFVSGEIVPPGEESVSLDETRHLTIEPDWVRDTGGSIESLAYDGYMNEAEFSFCKWPSRYRICSIAKSEADLAGDLALREAQENGFWPGSRSNGGRVDAYRHCIWNALMAYEMGSKTAKGFGDRHELGSKPDHMSEAEAELHHRMDYHNNAWGRYFGQYGKDVDMTRAQAESVLPGWCLQSVSDFTLIRLWY
ncbi:cell wall-binding repeat-containing protein [Streptomyces marincola]|nr:cell wall-binding repeat-containing protein [Streptomyces marincola]